jgi:LPPG:FO 2-phospho-L-lactate transferase
LKNIVYLSGGVGGAKFAKGLYSLNNINLTILVNTGDDEFINGVALSPDIDTVIYNLAEIQGEYGWGIKKDKFSVHEHLNYFLETTFRIGDKDLGLNLFRNQMLHEGKTLTEVTSLIKNKFQITCEILPMTDSDVQTKLVTKENQKLDFQDYFVKKQGKPRLKKIIYQGSAEAKVSGELISKIKESDIVIIGPSNPLLSIGPILSLKKIRNELVKHKNVVVISPFINKKAVKGPSEKNFIDLGFHPSIEGLKKYYKNVVKKYYVQFGDSDKSFNVTEENIFFRNKNDAKKLAKKILEHG